MRENGFCFFAAMPRLKQSSLGSLREGWTMVGRRQCVGVAALLATVFVAVAAVQLQDAVFSMTFRVQKDQYDRALQETKELLDEGVALLQQEFCIVTRLMHSM